jgi:hypothetical protein
MLNRAARRLLGVDPSLLGAAVLLGGGTAATPR